MACNAVFQVAFFQHRPENLGDREGDGVYRLAAELGVMNDGGDGWDVSQIGGM